MDKFAPPKFRAARHPLRAALEIELLSFHSDENPEVVPKFEFDTSIQRLAGCDRLSAAYEADAYLTQAIGSYSDDPLSLTVGYQLADALSVWAVTRGCLRLSGDALYSVKHAVQWAQHFRGTRLSARIHQRSAWLLAQEIDLSPGAGDKLRFFLNRHIETALYDHLLAQDDQGVAAVLVDTARLHVRAGNHSMARQALNAALNRTGKTPSLRAEAYFLKALSYFGQGSFEQAALAAEQTSVERASISLRQQLDALDLQSRIQEALENQSSALAMRVEALRLSATSLGIEHRLECLLAIGSVFQGRLNQGVEQAVEEAAAALITEIDDAKWTDGIKELHLHLLSPDPRNAIPRCLVQELRSQLEEHHQLKTGGPNVQISSPSQAEGSEIEPAAGDYLN